MTHQTTIETDTDRSHPDTVLANILRRYLHGHRWWIADDGGLLAIDDCLDLTAGERDAVRAVKGK